MGNPWEMDTPKEKKDGTREEVIVYHKTWLLLDKECKPDECSGSVPKPKNYSVWQWKFTNKQLRNNVRLRILPPVDNQIMQIIEELKKVFFRLDVRALIESTESNRVAIVLADRKESIIVETEDDTKDNMYHAAGLSIYSNNKSIVSSYLAIFETLWKQSQPTI
jgi:hypothetical protein